MTREWEVYESKCEPCDHVGLIKGWTDDWDGVGVEFEGFWASQTRKDRTGRETIAHPSVRREEYAAQSLGKNGPCVTCCQRRRMRTVRGQGG